MGPVHEPAFVPSQIDWAIPNFSYRSILDGVKHSGQEPLAPLKLQSRAQALAGHFAARMLSGSWTRRLSLAIWPIVRFVLHRPGFLCRPSQAQQP
jgi:hypothetical protein